MKQKKIYILYTQYLDDERSTTELVEADKGADLSGLLTGKILESLHIYDTKEEAERAQGKEPEQKSDFYCEWVAGHSPDAIIPDAYKTKDGKLTAMDIDIDEYIDFLMEGRDDDDYNTITTYHKEKLTTNSGQ